MYKFNIGDKVYIDDGWEILTDCGVVVNRKIEPDSGNIYYRVNMEQGQWSAQVIIFEESQLKNV